MSGLKVTQWLSCTGGASRMGRRKQVGVMSKGYLGSNLPREEVRHGLCLWKLFVGQDIPSVQALPCFTKPRGGLMEISLV